MAKFHINKHGVPAPCHAKKGNCPLGGNTGDENHFDSAEEAQAHVDQVNESKHGILPKLGDKEMEAAFNEEYRLSSDDLGAGTVGWNYVTYTDPDYETIENEDVRQLLADKFGEDSFVVEVDENEDPMSYSLDGMSEGSIMPYKDAIDRSAFDRGVVDENGEWTPEFRADLSKHLKENEGEVQDVFGKKLRKALSPHDGADFLRNYNKTKNIEVPEEVFNSVFEESYSDQGFIATGPNNFFFEDANRNRGKSDEYSENLNKVYDSLPKEFHDEVKGEEAWRLVPEHNIETHMREHVLTHSEQENYNQVDNITDSIRKVDPKYVDNDYDNEIDSELVDDMARYSAEKLKSESKLSFNGSKIILAKPNSDNRNWGQEYIDDGEFDKYRKNNPKG